MAPRDHLEGDSSGSEYESNNADDDNWGTRKGAYYGADDVSDEEDVRAEEEEARNIQRQHLQALNAEDFLSDLDDDDDNEDQESTRPPPVVDTSLEPDLSKLSKAEISDLLDLRYPFLRKVTTLYADFTELKTTFDEKNNDIPANLAEGAELVNATLCAALASFTMYLATTCSLNSSRKFADSAKAENLINSVLRSWEAVQHLYEILINPELVDKIRGKHEMGNGHTSTPESNSGSDSSNKRNVDHKLSPRFPSNSKIKSQTLEIPSDGYDFAGRLAAIHKKGIQSATKARNQAAGGISDEDDDFREAVALSSKENDANEKRKRSLRFYAGEIEQKAVSRMRSRAKMMTGDSEYFRESRREREAKWQQQEENRKNNILKRKEKDLGANDGLDGNINEGTFGDSEDERYYQAAAQKQEQRKLVKQGLRRDGEYLDGLDDGGHSKRGINRDIAKNKSMVPRKKKEDRNPRVKRRRKYEEKKKRLGGKKQSYKGAGKGPYGGEMSGISNVIKSTKLA